MATTPLKTIVIGTSLTQDSDGIVRTGVAIARATGATPWLVHAYVPPIYPSALDSGESLWIVELANALREELTQQAFRTGLTDVPGFVPDQLRLLTGSPPRELVDLARQVKADLLVIGATEGGALHRALHRTFLGSTADGAIRQAPCPVLAIRDASAFPPTRVEIPVDLSPVSAEACRQGLDFLARIGVPVAETEALFVLNPFEMGGSLHFKPEQVVRFASEELRRFLEANSSAVIPRLALVRTGYPRDEILTALRERKVDLAILGTHGRTGFDRFTLGSVTSEVMHRASCNLLIVPPGAAARREDAVDHRGELSYVSDEVLV
jgi:nucleotide-binding universal stress UspA family protein